MTLPPHTMETVETSEDMTAGHVEIQAAAIPIGVLPNGVTNTQKGAGDVRSTLILIAMMTSGGARGRKHDRKKHDTTHGVPGETIPSQTAAAMMEITMTAATQQT